MKATGIVRRIDDLGRVVIPKEIRRTMRIRESEPLEIYTGKEGEIILKKYSPISEMSEFARQYAESMSQASGRTTLVADRDQFIAVSGGGKGILGKAISRELEERLEKGNAFWLFGVNAILFLLWKICRRNIFMKQSVQF